MAIRQIVKASSAEGLKTLTTKSVPYNFIKDIKTNPIDEIIEDLRDTLMSEETGVGIAGNQIDINVRIFATMYSGRFKVFINPELRALSDDFVDFKESCLSHPGVETLKRRHKSLILRWKTAKNRICIRRFEGFMAIVIQHEMDHLAGKFCLDGPATGGA